MRALYMEGTSKKCNIFDNSTFTACLPSNLDFYWKNMGLVYLGSVLLANHRSNLPC